MYKQKYLFVLTYMFINNQLEEGTYECRLFTNNEELTVSQYNQTKETVLSEANAASAALISCYRFINDASDNEENKNV